MSTDDLKYWVAFSRIPSIGRARFQTLQQRFGTLREAWSTSTATLEDAGLDRRSVTAINATRPKIDPDAEMERYERSGIRVLTWADPDYPPRLKEIYDLPPLLVSWFGCVTITSLRSIWVRQTGFSLVMEDRQKARVAAPIPG